jgi:DNA-binding transcriptional LysR family regulator
MPKFQKQYPEVKVELRLSERRIQLREEEFDVDLQIAAPRDPSLMQRRLLASERILVASPDYAAQTPALRDPDGLAAHRCLTYWLGPEDVVWKFMRKGSLQEMVVPSSFSSNNGHVLKQLAVMGHGIALLDDYTVADELARGGLVRLLRSYRVTNSTFDEGIYATFLQTNYLAEKIRVFLDFMTEHVPRQIGAGAAQRIQRMMSLARLAPSCPRRRTSRTRCGSLRRRPGGPAANNRLRCKCAAFVPPCNPHVRRRRLTFAIAIIN